MNCFYGMVNRRKAFNLITSREHCITRQNHCQRSSPLQISDTLQAGFEPAQNLKLGFDEFSSILFFRGKIINFLFPNKSLLASTFWGYVPVSSRLYVPVSSRLYCLLTYLFEPFVQRLIAWVIAPRIRFSNISYFVKNVHIRSYSGPNFPAFRLNMESTSPYSVRMRENADRNNSE